MGLECSPQLANLYGYAVESTWVDQGGRAGPLARRFIDDIIVGGPNALVPGLGLPSEDDYEMKYKKTSESPDSLIYLGSAFLRTRQDKPNRCSMTGQWNIPSKWTDTQKGPQWRTQPNWQASSWGAWCQPSAPAVAWIYSKTQWPEFSPMPIGAATHVA